MSKTSFLVGTNHAHQYPWHKDGRADSFAEYLREAVTAQDIDLVAEEMSLEVLANQNLDTSTPWSVASELNISHLMCDPDSAERRMLGIPSYEELKTKRGLGCVVTEQDAAIIELDERAYWPLREAEWLRRLKAHPHFNCLFVLGSNHVESFTELLKKNGYVIHVLCARWEPCPSS